MGDESRGASPGRSLGRRGSYKTSRGEHPHSVAECASGSLLYLLGNRTEGSCNIHLFVTDFKVGYFETRNNIQFYLYIE